MYKWQADRQRPQKKVSFATTRTFFSMKMYISFTEITNAILNNVSIEGKWRGCSFMICKYEQILKSYKNQISGLAWTIISERHKPKQNKTKQNRWKNPLNVFSLRIPRINCLYCFKITDRSSSDVHWSHSANDFQLQRKHIGPLLLLF